MGSQSLALDRRALNRRLRSTEGGEASRLAVATRPLGGAGGVALVPSAVHADLARAF